MLSQPDPAPLGRIRFVLVETTHPGNIGAVARAMKTMGLGRLELVKPRHFPNADALALASGADDLLKRAGVHGDLTAALAGCRLAVGSSARLRSVEWPLLSPAECAERLVAEAAQGDVALVLGREKLGAQQRRACPLPVPGQHPHRPRLQLPQPGGGGAGVCLRDPPLLARPSARCGTRRRVRTGPARGARRFLRSPAAGPWGAALATPSSPTSSSGGCGACSTALGPTRWSCNILRGILSAAQGRKTAERFRKKEEAANERE